MAFYGVRFLRNRGEIIEYDRKPEGGAKKVLSDLGKLLCLESLDEEMYRKAVAVFEEIKWRYLKRERRFLLWYSDETKVVIEKINRLVPCFFQALPVELIEKIVGFLSLDGLLQLDRTCSQFDPLFKTIFRIRAKNWGICSTEYRYPKKAIQNCLSALKQVGANFDYRHFCQRKSEVKNYTFSCDQRTSEEILLTLKEATYPQKAAFVKTAATYANSYLIKSGPLISFVLNNLETDRFSFDFHYSLIDVLTLYSREYYPLEILSNTIPRSKLDVVYAGRNATVLVHAILRNDFSAFKRLLERGANPRKGGVKAPLIYAIEWNRELMVHRLLEALAFLPQGISTTLFVRATDGIFYMLLKKDPLYFLSKEGDKNYLLEAIKSCSVERISTLFSYHPKVNFEELCSAYRKSREVLNIVLKKGQFQPGVLHKFSIMMPRFVVQVIKNKELDLLEKLLKEGVDPNLIYENKSLLYWACKRASDRSSALMAELLIERGAKISQQEIEEILGQVKVHKKLQEILWNELG